MFDFAKTALRDKIRDSIGEMVEVSKNLKLLRDPNQVEPTYLTSFSFGRCVGHTTAISHYMDLHRNDSETVLVCLTLSNDMAMRHKSNHGQWLNFKSIGAFCKTDLECDDKYIILIDAYSAVKPEDKHALICWLFANHENVEAVVGIG
jgi:hypothetical protein